MIFSIDTLRFLLLNVIFKKGKEKLFAVKLLERNCSFLTNGQVKRSRKGSTKLNSISNNGLARLCRTRWVLVGFSLGLFEATSQLLFGNPVESRSLLETQTRTYETWIARSFVLRRYLTLSFFLYFFTRFLTANKFQLLDRCAWMEKDVKINRITKS